MMSAPDYTPQLQQLMLARSIPSYRSLCDQAQISRSQLQRLRQGNLRSLRVETLIRLSQCLQISTNQLLLLFSESLSPASAVEQAPPNPASTLPFPPSVSPAREADQAQLQHQLQAASLETLEPWLLQWATVSHAVQANPDLPASRVVPLVHPVEQLMTQWGVTAIAQVGAEVAFDPACHELMQGTAAPGDRVRVRYAGYRHGDRLLHRAKVSPVAAS